MESELRELLRFRMSGAPYKRGLAKLARRYNLDHERWCLESLRNMVAFDPDESGFAPNCINWQSLLSGGPVPVVVSSDPPPRLEPMPYPYADWNPYKDPACTNGMALSAVP